MNLEEKLKLISEKFDELEAAKKEHKEKINEIEVEQYRLQGEHRVVNSIIEELTSKKDEETN